MVISRYGIGRGNHTRGDERRGNKDGRKPLYAPGTPLGRINLTVPMELHSVLRAMGSGNATRGARIAAQLASKIMPLWMQDEDQVRAVLNQTFDGKATCRREVTEACARLEQALNPWGEEPPKRARVDAQDAEEDDSGYEKCQHGVDEISCGICSPMPIEEADE
jgi:hypothetical protein